MKKNLLIIIMLTVMMLSGCSKQQQMTNFIPTQAPEAEDSNSSEETGDTTQSSEASSEDSEATPTPKAIHVGETTTKYVKMDEFDAVLNVRATPSKDGDIVGFLVHTEKIEVIEIVDGWASFEYNDAICYVSADFLTDTRPDYIAPPTQAPTPIPANTPTPKPTPKPDSTTTDGDEAPPEI